MTERHLGRFRSEFVTNYKMTKVIHEKNVAEVIEVEVTRVVLYPVKENEEGLEVWIDE